MGLRPKRDELDAAKRAEKLELLRNAVSSHAKYIGSAAKAMGVDRHLLGLALSLSDGEIAPALYSHPLYTRAKTWRVSTSHFCIINTSIFNIVFYKAHKISVNF